MFVINVITEDILSNSVDPEEMTLESGISSGSSLFAKMKIIFITEKE